MGTQSWISWIALFSNFVGSHSRPLSLNSIAHLGFAKSLRFRSAISGHILLSMDRSSLLRKEPSITLRYLWLSRSPWIARLCFAKSLRLRSAICGYLALHGSLDKFDRSSGLCQARFTRTTACRNFEKSPKDYL